MERSPRTRVANSRHVLSQIGREGVSVDRNREPEQTRREKRCHIALDKKGGKEPRERRQNRTGVTVGDPDDFLVPRIRSHLARPFPFSWSCHCVCSVNYLIYEPA